MSDSRLATGENMIGQKKSEKSELSFFEFWPGWAFYTPIVIYWIALGLRYRDLSLPTLANPRIPTGGLCGERKSEILSMAGQVASAVISPWAIIHTGDNDYVEAMEAIQRNGISFPVVTKPDIGSNGTGVKLNHTPEELRTVLASYPRNITLMLQQLIPWEHEAGIFYIRHPGEKQGRITSITFKIIPSLTGDGHSTIQELLLADPRAGQVPHLYEQRLGGKLKTILPAGETLPLVFTGNHCKGAIFRNGEDFITPELTARIDAIMQDVPDFYFGRLDIRFRSYSELREGNDFGIIEINGTGSEPTHIWDAKTTLMEAWASQFWHYREAFRIGAANKKAGWKSDGVINGFREWFKHRALMRSYPMND
jgi:hypothetical protein